MTSSPTPLPTPMCNDFESCANFHFSSGFFIACILLTSFVFLYITIDYIINKKYRVNPSLLMLGRAVCDSLFVFIVLYLIHSKDDGITGCNPLESDKCKWWGSVLVFLLYISGMYYFVICIELYTTLRDPFKTPASGSIRTHFIIWICSILVPTLLGTLNGIDYRSDFQICFLKYRVQQWYWVNTVVIYIPAGFLVIGGVSLTIHNYLKLKQRISETTFFLRWTSMKRLFAVIFALTITYVIQGILWIIIFNDDYCQTKTQPYLLSVFAIFAVINDGIAWFIKNYLTKKSTDNDNKSSKKKNTANISDALRKEVITFIIAGISHSIKEITILEKSDLKDMGQIMRGISDNTNNITNAITNEKNTEIEITNNESLTLSQAASAIPGTFSKIFNFKSMISPSQYTQPLLNIKFTEDPTFVNSPNSISNMDLDNTYYPLTLDPKKGNNKNIISKPVGVCGKENNSVYTIDYAPWVFNYLRKKIYNISNEEYLESILPDKKHLSNISYDLVTKFSEGRSGAFFFFTHDMKYIIKTLNKSEAYYLLRTLPNYVSFMKENKNSYLSKYLGMHAIEMYQHKIYFVVTKNVFPPKNGKPDEIYDLKGSWVDRHTNFHVEDRKLMKDSDIRKKMLLDKNYSQQIHDQLDKDSKFLCSQNIMDYSLLLGIYYTKIPTSSIMDIKENENKKKEIYIAPKLPKINEQLIKIDKNGGNIESNGDEIKEDLNKNKISGADKYDIFNAENIVGPGKYCIGIIDMLQQWDINKRGERCLKVVFKGKDKNGLSCIQPVPYQERFMEKMSDIGM